MNNGNHTFRSPTYPLVIRKESGRKNVKDVITKELSLFFVIYPYRTSDLIFNGTQNFNFEHLKFNKTGFVLQRN